MSCELYYTNIQSPESYLFGTLFTMMSIAAVLGNTIGVLVLRQPELKSIKNRIVTSLCVIGCLVGYGFLPMFAWEMFDSKNTNICFLRVPRELISSIMYITAIWNFCLLTSDRYILLTKGASVYDEEVSHRKTVIYICISWIAPPSLVSILYIVKEYQSLIMSIVYVLTLIVCFTLYIILKKKISEKEDEMKDQVTNYFFFQSRRSVLDRTNKSRYVYSAKNLNLIMALVVCCLLPVTCGNIVYLIVPTGAVQNARAFEIYYVMSVLIATSLSCTHLVIYYNRYPEFYRSFWKFFKVQEKMENCKSCV